MGEGDIFLGVIAGDGVSGFLVLEGGASWGEIGDGGNFLCQDMTFALHFFIFINNLQSN